MITEGKTTGPLPNIGGMLLKKAYAANDVVGFKLASGEEIIARIKEVNPDHYLLSKPMNVVHTPQGIALAPVMFTYDPDDSMVLNKHAVSLHTRCRKDLAAQYLQNTTNLTLAQGV